MRTQNIIFDASVLAKFPQSSNFFKTARDSAMGSTAYIRSHCKRIEDILYLLPLLQRKGIGIIVLSKTPAGTADVLRAFGIPYDRCVLSLDALEGEPSDYGYVTPVDKSRKDAAKRGFKAVRFIPGAGQDAGEILALAGYRKATDHNRLTV